MASAMTPAPAPVRTAHQAAVFLSPHLDDAVFSCGGLISRLAEQGCRPLVINVFSRAGVDFRTSAGTDDTRIEEEHAVSGYLGFCVRFVGECDAWFRKDAYKSLSGLFMADPRSYAQELERIRSAIAAALRDVSCDVVYAPLGIGWHVDHLLTHLAARSLIDPGRLRFYEDAPYMLLPHLQEYRLAELDPRRPVRTGGSSFRHARRAGRHYAATEVIRSRFRPWLRPFVRPFLDAWFHRLLRSGTGRVGGPLALEPVVEDVTAALDSKVHACALYRTQFPQFFGSARECSEMLRAYSAGIGSDRSYWERYWTPCPDRPDAAAG
ncbi:MAG: PIG-L family deacetylase [Burkholderiales bacterium]|nr:PIG-L family deacetylase [Burkholderiales bacterium]